MNCAEKLCLITYCIISQVGLDMELQISWENVMSDLYLKCSSLISDYFFNLKAIYRAV